MRQVVWTNNCTKKWIRIHAKGTNPAPFRRILVQKPDTTEYQSSFQVFFACFSCLDNLSHGSTLTAKMCIGCLESVCCQTPHEVVGGGKGPFGIGMSCNNIAILAH